MSILVFAILIELVLDWYQMRIAQVKLLLLCFYLVFLSHLFILFKKSFIILTFRCCFYCFLFLLLMHSALFDWGCFKPPYKSIKLKLKNFNLSLHLGGCSGTHWSALLPLSGNGSQMEPFCVRFAYSQYECVGFFCKRPGFLQQSKNKLYMSIDDSKLLLG